MNSVDLDPGASSATEIKNHTDDKDETTEKSALVRPSYSKGVNPKALSAEASAVNHLPEEKDITGSNPKTEMQSQTTETPKNDVG